MWKICLFKKLFKGCGSNDGFKSGGLGFALTSNKCCLSLLACMLRYGCLVSRRMSLGNQRRARVQGWARARADTKMQRYCDQILENGYRMGCL